MKSIKTNSVILICGVLLIMMFSCTKDNDSSLVNSNSEVINEKEHLEKFDDNPIVQKDRYVFRDFDHLTKYYHYLDKIYSIDEQLFIDEVLQNSKIGYRDGDERGFISVFDILYNDIYDNPLLRYMPFLTDPVMMSIVNKFYEFQIGNILVTYMNNNDLLISDGNDISTQNEIRNMPKGGKLDFNAIPKGSYWGEDTNETSLRAWCSCDIKIKPINCNEVEIFGTCKDFFGNGHGLINVYISYSRDFPNENENWPSPYLSNRVDGSFSYIIPVNTNETKYIHASANPDCITGTTKKITYKLNPSESTCDFEDRSTPWLWAQDSGIQGMSYRTSYYRNFWSTYASAEIYSKYWDGNQWKRNNQKLSTTIQEYRKNELCVNYDYEDETKACNSCSYKRARVNTGIFGDGRFLHHCDGDVTGIFKKTLNWQGQTWSIDGVGSIDFECCQ